MLKYGSHAHKNLPIFCENLQISQQSTLANSFWYRLDFNIFQHVFQNTKPLCRGALLASSS